MIDLDIYSDNPLANKIVEDQDLKLDIAHNMTTFGGSFVQALSKCIITADRDNLRKFLGLARAVTSHQLVLAFPNYIRDYQPKKWSKK